MNKLYPDAAAALDGLLFDGMTIAAGGFGLCGIPENLIVAIRGQRREGPDDRLEQCRRRWLRPRPAAGDAAGEEDGLVLCRREQGVRAAVSRRRARDRVQPAGHARRAVARRRRRDRRLLHQDRRRHAGRRGQAARRVRRRDLHARARHRRRSGDREGVEGRSDAATLLFRKTEPQFQPDRRDRRHASPSPRSRRSCPRAASMRDAVHTPGHLRPAARARHDSRSASSSARSRKVETA